MKIHILLLLLLISLNINAQDRPNIILIMADDLGYSGRLKLLIVVHTYKENDEAIRIISARKATKNESKYYHRAR